MRWRRWVWPVVGLVGVLIFLLLSRVADPEAQVDLNTTRNQSLALSRQWLVEQGFDLTGYEGAVSFESDENALLYLQRNYALAESNQLARDYKVWHWSVRWFKPGEQIEYKVTVDTAQPQVLGFSRTYPESTAGASLNEEDALAAAQRFLEQNGYPLSNWELVGSRAKQQSARTDYHFEWQQKGVSLKGAFPKVDVDLQGSQLSGLHHYLLVPAQFQRTYQETASVGTALALISSTLMIGLWILAAIWSILLARRAAWGLGLWGALLLVVVSLAGALNELTQLKSRMPTFLPPAVSYVFGLFVALLAALLYVAGVLFPAAAGQGLLRQMDRDGAPYFSRIRQGSLLSAGFGRSSLRGLAVAGVMLGYDTLFYFVGRQYFGVWTPAAPSYSDILATPAPWLYPLTIGITAAFTEEYTFRLFGTAIAKRWLKWTPVALVLPAAIWAFAHSNYPVFPVWTRGIELTLMGTFLGWVFWRYDIETTVVAHYTYDALLVGWPLLLSGNTYYVASGALVIGLALLPALSGWVAVRRTRKVEAPAENAALISPSPAPEAPAVNRAEQALPAFSPQRPEIGGAFLNRLLGGIRAHPVP
ncbi:MAG: CPBP family intramembrane glutamic endopeptidase, partial [Mycobacterium leprae]